MAKPVRNDAGGILSKNNPLVQLLRKYDNYPAATSATPLLLLGVLRTIAWIGPQQGREEKSYYCMLKILIKVLFINSLYTS
jgi:hypothetical protein